MNNRIPNALRRWLLTGRNTRTRRIPTTRNTWLDGASWSRDQGIDQVRTAA